MVHHSVLRVVVQKLGRRSKMHEVRHGVRAAVPLSHDSPALPVHPAHHLLVHNAGEDWPDFLHLDRLMVFIFKLDLLPAGAGCDFLSQMMTLRRHYFFLAD